MKKEHSTDPIALLLAATCSGVCHCLSRVLESALCLSKTSTVAYKYRTLQVNAGLT